RERDRTLIRGFLREPEPHAVVGDRGANGGDTVARLGGALQERDQIAAFEVRLRRGFPRRELELGLGDREDRAEGVLPAFAFHHRGDQTAAGEAKRADLRVAAYL